MGFFRIPQAREILDVYRDQIFRNIKETPESALTGPIARGDLQTIRNNIEALHGHPLGTIYRAFVTSYLTTQKRGSENDQHP